MNHFVVIKCLSDYDYKIHKAVLIKNNKQLFENGYYSNLVM